MHGNIKPPSFLTPWQQSNTYPDAQAKQVLKEAVDAVVNSFAKHTQGYGRGQSDNFSKGFILLRGVHNHACLPYQPPPLP